MKQQGFTMIEVLITVAITSVGLWGLISMQLQATKSVMSSDSRSKAIWVMNDLVNRIRANEVADYSLENEISCTAFPENLKVCATYHNGSDTVAADTSCTSDELATFDTWEVLCGMPNSQNAETGSSSTLNNPSLSITPLADGYMDINISWESRSAGKDADDNTIYLIEKANSPSNYREDYRMVFRP